MAARVNRDSFSAEVLQSEKPVLVDFYSDSCIPCKQMSPLLGELEEEHEGQLRVVKVNVNFDGELAERYDVLATPTLIGFAGGDEVCRTQGFQNKEELRTLVQKLL